MKVANTWPVGYASASIARHKLKKPLVMLHELDDIVEFTFNFKALGISIKPTQVKDEIRDLLRHLTPKPKVVLEIGTASGGALFMFARIAQPDATIISIDLPGGMFGGGYPKWKSPLYKSFAHGQQKVYLLCGDSHDPAAASKVQKILGERKIDFLFIDGDHTYEGVKKDFEMYSSLVRNGGIIALHDIVHGTLENVGGVPKFWSEIKCKFEYLEIVKSWNQKGYGIGIIYV
jgi:predicted O-methyltransferase YrrM